MRFGYFLSREEHPPEGLVRQAGLAELAGFASLWICWGQSEDLAAEFAHRLPPTDPQRYVGLFEFVNDKIRPQFVQPATQC